MSKVYDELRELIAAECHSQWIGWMKWMVPKLLDENMLPRGLNYKRDEPGTTSFRWSDTALDCLERWIRQMGTPYAELSEKEKNSDRVEADKIIALLNEHGYIEVTKS